MCSVVRNFEIEPYNKNFIELQWSSHLLEHLYNVAVPPPNVDNNDCQHQDVWLSIEGRGEPRTYVGEMWSRAKCSN